MKYDGFASHLKQGKCLARNRPKYERQVIAIGIVKCGAHVRLGGRDPVIGPHAYLAYERKTCPAGDITIPILGHDDVISRAKLRRVSVQFNETCRLHVILKSPMPDKPKPRRDRPGHCRSKSRR